MVPSVPGTTHSLFNKGRASTAQIAPQGKPTTHRGPWLGVSMLGGKT